MSNRQRRALSNTLIALAGLALAAATLAAFVKFEVTDADRFSDRAVSAVMDSHVRQNVAEDITEDLIIGSNGDLVAFRPLLRDAVNEALRSAPFRSLLTTAVADFHRTVIGGRSDTVAVLVTDVGVLVKGALAKTNPGLSRRIPAALDADLTAGDVPESVARPVRATNDIARLTLPLGLLCAALFAAGIAAAPRRRAAANASAIAITAAGALVALLGLGLDLRLTGAQPTVLETSVVEPVAEAFVDALITWGFFILASGLVLLAAFRSLIRPVDLRSRLARAREILTGPMPNRWWSLARGIAMIATGLLLIFARDWVWQVIMIGAGSIIVFLGIEQLLLLLGRNAESTDGGAREKASGRRRRRWIVAAVAGGLFVLLGGGLFASDALLPPKNDVSGTCNGSAELCDRPLNEVAFATTHNSMGGEDISDWLFAQQDRRIGGQLEDGIRGLMIDAHYGRQVSDGVRTEIDRGKLNRELNRLFGAQGAASSERIRNRLIGGGKPGPKKLWLCHTVCEVGAVPMKESLEEIRDFLVRNPEQVIMVMIQDEDVAPASIAEDFRASGLLDYVYEEPVDEGFPTLGEMIELNRRVLVFAENDTDPAIPWYHPQFEYIQETPYHYTQPSQMVCRANRGRADAPLFLINHWIDSSPAPRPSNARKVNDFDFLWERVKRCEDERGLFPNFIAVDFYRRGDLFEVVDRLNGTEEDG